MSDRWYQKAVIYCLDIDTFADSNGDGVGDIRGLIGRLDYLARLGINCLWLNPIHPTPNIDDGYDVSNFYDVDPRFGNLGDFAELLHEAGNLGIKVIIDLVVNHTSDQHPWFQSARSSPDSPYRDWYVWADSAPTTDPAVAARNTSTRLTRPSLARNPASDSTISLGIGGIRFSRATRKPTPSAPSDSMTDVTHAVRPPPPIGVFYPPNLR